MNLYVQEVLWTMSRINSRRPTLLDTVKPNCWKTKTDSGSSKKETCHIQGIPVRLSANFSIQTLEVRR